MNLPTIHDHMLPVPAGRITMRDDRIGVSWTVEISSFFLGRYPVTRQLYSEATNGQSQAEGRIDHPMHTVSWLDAARFCNRLSVLTGLPPFYEFVAEDGDAVPTGERGGFRLPTEAEWEYACRAGTSGPRYDTLEDIAWYKGNSGGGTRSVGQKRPNAWGLHDMLGNVWEWCDDVYDEDVYGRYRVFRGGGWADDPRGCLATNRRRSHPTFAIDDLGFRIARSA